MAKKQSVGMAGIESIPYVGPAVAGAGKVLGGAYNDVFGSGDPGGNQLWHALFGGGGKGGGKPATPSSQTTVDDLIKGLTGSEVENPQGGVGGKLVQQLAQLIGGMPAAQSQAELKKLSGPLGQEVTAVLEGGPPSAASSQTNPLVQALMQVYTGSIAPALKDLQSTSSKAIDADITGLQNTLKGTSPQFQAAMGSIPQQLKASEDLLSSSTLNAEAGAPLIQALLQAITGQSQGYKAAQQALGILPYYQAATQGVTPTIPGALGSGGITPPGTPGLITPPTTG